MYFEENIRVIRNNNPVLAEAILQVDTSSFEVLRSASGHLNLMMNFSGGRDFLCSNANPEQEVSQWFKKQNLNDVEVLFVYGVGLGYYYEPLKKWLRSAVNHYVVFLEDDLRVWRCFLETKNAYDMLRDSQVTVSFFDEIKERHFFELFYKFSFANVLASSLQSYAQHKQSRFDLLSQCIYKGFFNVVDRFRERKFVNLLYYNLFKNIQKLPSSRWGNKLAGKFKGMPAIICGAGPSLEKQLSTLSTLTNNALFFSGLSAGNVLSSQGINPHFLVAIDPNYPQYDRFLLNNSFMAPFIYRYRANFSILNLSNSEKIFVSGHSTYSLVERIEDSLKVNKVDRIEEGHSIVDMCVDLARMMGCDPIILVGVDLALTDQKFYSQGTVSDDEGDWKSKNLKKGLCLVKDIYGKDINSFDYWVAESKWLAEYVKNHPECTFINATEGGIGCGANNLPLVDVKRKFLSRVIDCNGAVYSCLQQVERVPVKDSDVKNVLLDVRSSYDSVSDICVELLDVLKQLIEEVSTCGSNLSTEYLSILEDKLNKEEAYSHTIHEALVAYECYITRRQNELLKESGLSPQQKVCEILKLHENKTIDIRQLVNSLSDMITMSLS